MTHTPTPWKVVQLGFGYYKIVSSDMLPNGMICSLGPYQKEDNAEEMRDHADLIAAAPELLEAAKHCLKVFQSQSDRGRYPSELMPFSEGTQENPDFLGKQGWEFLSQAIAKAEQKDTP